MKLLVALDMRLMKLLVALDMRLMVWLMELLKVLGVRLRIWFSYCDSSSSRRESDCNSSSIPGLASLVVAFRASVLVVLVSVSVMTVMTVWGLVRVCKGLIVHWRSLLAQCRSLSNPTGYTCFPSCLETLFGCLPGQTLQAISHCIQTLRRGSYLGSKRGSINFSRRGCRQRLCWSSTSSKVDFFITS
jgi:hypothetical protein